MAVVYGMRMLTGTPLVLIALAGVIALLWRGLSKPERAASLVVLALAAFMVLPAYAFYRGHPFRMRYMIAPAVGVIGLCGHCDRPAARLAAARCRDRRGRLASWQPSGRWTRSAPMVQEAQWDRPVQPRTQKRHRVPDARVSRRAHPRQHGIPCPLHAGAVARGHQHPRLRARRQPAVLARSDRLPKDHVGWILVEERAEGGDISPRARANHRSFSPASRASAPTAAWHCTDKAVKLELKLET